MRTLASLAALALVACSPTPTPSIAPAPSIAPSTVRSASASADAQIVADAAVPIEDAPAPSSIAPVITIDGVRMVVIAEETDPSWGVGLARSLRHADDIDDSLLALRDVDREALPADVRARAADRWSLLGPSTCRVHLGTPVLVRRSDGSFAAYGEGEDTTAPVADPRSLDARLWSSGLEVLAAPIVVDEGECAGAEVALPVARPAERTFRGTPALSRALAREARAAFADMTAFQSLQVEYAEYLRSDESGDDDGPTWPEYGGTDSTFVELLRAGDGTELVEVTAHGEEFCGGFSGSLFALFERTDSGLRLIDSGPIDAAPFMVLDGIDGSRAYVGHERWRRVGDADESGWPVWHDVRSPWLGCNC